MRRRDFLKAVSLAAGSPLAKPVLAQERPPKEDVLHGDMRYRPLGRTGLEVSIVGLGGHHIGRIKDEAESLRLIRDAIDAGVTFLDNCWDYHDGLSEVRMGKALAGAVRDKVVLMTKFDGRTRAAAARQIDESLARLRTDRIDLLQFHEVLRLEDPDRYFAAGGAAEAVDAARKAGKVRFVGFTGHKDPLVHLRMLDAAAKHGYRFDTVQMPVNLMDAHFRSFTASVLPLLVREEIGALAMKSMGDGHLLKSGAVTPLECLHYAMNQPVSCVVTGIDSDALLRQALDAVKSFRRMSSEEVQQLLKKTAGPAADGRFEPFKTDVRFDGTAQHPEWMG